ncbi:related to LSB5 - possible role in the regulation of actin cytoskeletal organization [Cephalotrichum gorgonifer]|uniref:Related to LSB5 - possible role in the regulation of actin cytoskeletal organization n=1 Tax=Cephalotrichum gorgonifer TaxID=2041049 RepID=A0AAE8SXL3_9PEZI|nr:related to LSB5 - possible role in the regulation of actin cytoskeletal organization [Cephalotrichum gorgonifer]
MPKPYTAVTVSIESLTSESYEEDDLSGIPELVEVIMLQASGPTEAARAIRKKLKYGNVHRQIRALVLLDGLIQNAGSRFQRCFCDEALLERLRVCGTGSTSHPEVRKKCNELFKGWAQFKNVDGMKQIASLHKQLPRRKAAVTQEKSKVIRETENPFDDDEEDEDELAKRGESSKSGESSRSSRPPYEQSAKTVQSFSQTGHARSSSSGSFFGSSSKDKDRKKKDKKSKKRRPFSLEDEKEHMKATIAEASIAATNLMNALKSINREIERISENRAAVEGFETCKQLRRKILRYIHHVESEQWLGSLLHANDELILALLTYEQLDHSIDADSDSEDELAEQAHLYRMAQLRGRESNPTSPTGATPDIAGLNLDGSPPRPAPPPRPPVTTKPVPSAPQVQRPRYTSDDESEEEDDDDPFADSNVMASTPHLEQSGFTI